MSYRFLCTGDTEAFEAGSARRFLQMPLGPVERVELRPSRRAPSAPEGAP